MSAAEYLQWLQNAVLTIVVLFTASGVGFLLVTLSLLMWRDLFGNDKEEG